MEGQNEEDEGLPDVYLSPSHVSRADRNSGPPSNDSDQNVWDDTDGEVWVPLKPRTKSDEMDTSLESQHQMSCALGLREEIEGKSSLESSVAGTSMLTDASQLHALNNNQHKRMPEGAGNNNNELTPIQNADVRAKEIVQGERVAAWSRQRGETPGSDCPPVAGTGALPRTFRQNLNLDTNFPPQLSSELVFSPGGDEGFMVPGGVHAYYESGSDTEGLEWSMGAEHQGDAVAPYRDVVEGADNATPVPQSFSGNRSSGLRAMERNSPAGLSTPDADVDVNITVAKSHPSRKSKSSIRPPGVGQSEELLVQSSRKDLGSTDGEESENDGIKRPVLRESADLFSAPEAQPGSLGSQSENTDSVNTVLDMSRGEVQGCENDETLGTPVLTPPVNLEAATSQPNQKPTFVIGGPISPRGKYRQFQNTVRGRMQDVKASLEMQPGLDLGVHIDRDQFLSQPPLYTPVTPVSEQETSLASMISVETTHPDSSDRVTSPSVLSVSSAASSKRLEWDSGADVGYVGNTPETLTASLSTLERIAIGNYASVLRTEPEGTTQVKEKLKNSKKSYKSNAAKAGGSLTSVRRSIPETVSTLPSRSLRVPQSRERKIVSSSDEEFDSRLTSPSQSPRRKPRKRSSVAKDSDAQVRKSSGQFTHGRIREIMREISNEGKSSSLVELHQTSKSSGECRRSSSQQSLSLSHTVKESDDIRVSKARVTPGPTAPAISRNTIAAINANTSTSTSTLVQSMSPLPLQGISASTSSTLVEGASNTCSKSELGINKSSDDDVGSSRSSSQLKGKLGCLNLKKRTYVSSGNDVSSKSQESSDLETPSEMKDTDMDSCNSVQLSEDEPVNLKAKKNSRNARSHGNIRRPCGESSGLGSQLSFKNKSNKNERMAQKGEVLDSSESVLESQVSLQASNNSLQALSVKLKQHIKLLLDQGTMKKVQDYNKLQDYIEFIGIPSTNEEECRLKYGVAGVITRMFGEIEAEDTDTSNTFNSETSEALTTDSHVSETSPQNLGTNDSTPAEDLSKGGSLTSADPSLLSDKTVNEEDEEQERSVTPGGTVTLKAYRPPSATRTYFMAVSKECDEGLVEGQRTVTPESGPPSFAFSQGLELDRGQAEGQREETESGIPSLSPRFWQQEDRNYPAEDDSSAQDIGARGASARNRKDEDTESFSETVTLPPGWGLSLRKTQALSSGAVTSDECSPRHVGRWSVLDRRSSWHEEDLDERFRNAGDWKTATTRSERLYKDKRGTLHVANQPPGYMDDRDSHPSESTSEHEHQNRGNDTESHDDGRRGAARPWTSSGSESAYETIRERHRHVDEALASSFEFYSTSPRDARLLGYMSSDAAKDEEGQDENEPINDEGSQLDHITSPASSEQQSLSRPVHTKKRNLRRQHPEELHSTLSSHTDANDVSSQVSFIQLQKQKYVRRIHRHIHTLEKLERALMEQLGDSIGSENNFRRCVTEGRSQTESDTNIRSQTRDILGQSETATSSIISSDYSDDHINQGIKRQSSRSRSIESQATGQENQSHSSGKKSDSLKSMPGISGFNSLGQSYVSSPRVTLNPLGTDLTSSRTSTLKRIEKEVKKLAHAEERSRQVMHKRKHPRSTIREGREGPYFQNVMKKMQREEPRGEEGPKKSQAKSSRVVSDDHLSARSRKGDSSDVDSGKRLPRDKTAKVQKGKSRVTSDDSDKSVSNNQLLRQGDGREAKEGNQATKVPPLLYKSNSRAQLDSPPTRDAPKKDSQKDASSHGFSKLYPSVKSSPRKVTNALDFGQMFPSVESFALSDDDHQDCDQDGRSIGIQTGASLLCLPNSSSEAVSLKHRSDVAIVHLPEKDNMERGEKNGKNQEGKRQLSRPSSGTGRGSSEHKEKGSFSERETQYRKKQMASNGHTEREFEGEVTLPRPNSGSVSEHAIKTARSTSSSRPGSSKNPRTESSGDNQREKPSDAKISARQVIGDNVPTSKTNNSMPCTSREANEPSRKHKRPNSSRENKHADNDKTSSRPVSAREVPRSRMSERNLSIQYDEQSGHGYISSNRSTEMTIGTAGRYSLADHEAVKHIPDKKRQSEERKKLSKSSSNESLIILKDQGQSSSVHLSATSSEVSSGRSSYRDQSSIDEGGNPLLVVNNYSSDMQLPDTNRESIPRKGLSRNQKNKKQNVDYKRPVQFDISIGNKENYVEVPPQVMPTAEKSKKDVTLQEALVKARPKYIREAEDRWAMIRWKREMRRDAQTHNHKVVAQLPANLQTPSTLQRFLYKPDAAPLFSYKDIRKQNQRLYQLLPESRNPEVLQMRRAQNQTNRLMAGIYSQKLKKKVLKGQVSHAHAEILTPPALAKYQKI